MGVDVPEPSYLPCSVSHALRECSRSISSASERRLSSGGESSVISFRICSRWWLLAARILHGLFISNHGCQRTSGEFSSHFGLNLTVNFCFGGGDLTLISTAKNSGQRRHFALSEPHQLSDHSSNKFFWRQLTRLLILLCRRSVRIARRKRFTALLPSLVAAYQPHAASSFPSAPRFAFSSLFFLQLAFTLPCSDTTV